MKKIRIKFSPLCLDQLGIETRQYINGGNLHHGIGVSDYPIENLTQNPVNGEWYGDVPNDDRELDIRFGRHFIGRNSEETPIISAFL